MKRFLPFVIIAAVALLTVGIATAVYRKKMQPAPKAAATITTTPTPADEKEDPLLHARGARKAPLTLEIYGDFQCPSCSLVSQLIDDLQVQYTDKLRVVFHEFPLEMHEHALEAAMAAEAAGLQGKFWEMHDRLYRYQQVWSKASNAGFFFEAYAKEIGLNIEQFQADRTSPDVKARIMADGGTGTVRGVKNTPTLFLNGDMVQAGFTKEKLQEAIEAALAAKKSS